MGFANFLKTARKLNRMGRWATEYMTDDVRPTIASHSFTTTQVAQMLGVIEESSGTEINWKELYEKVINHDFIETLTGDVLSHVKNRNKQIKKQIVAIEKELAEIEIFSSLPDRFQDAYRKMLFNGKDDTPEGKILAASDTIDLLIECVIEVERGNPEPIFERAYYNSVKKLKSIDLYCVKYFLDNILDEFIMDMGDLRIKTHAILGKEIVD